MGVQLVTPESIGTFVAVAAGTTPPSSAPVLSLSSYTDTTIDVSCTSVPGATGYKFYKDGSLVATQAGTTYQYTGLTSNTAYALTCKAYNGAGDSSASNTVNQTTKNLLTNLIAEWKDNDTSGNSTDSVAGTYTLTAIGTPGTATGIINGCRTLNGSQGFGLAAPDNNIAGIGTNWSFSTFFWLGNVSAATANIFTCRVAASGNLCYLLRAETNSLKLYIGNGSGTLYTSPSLATLTSGAWHSFAMSFNDTTKEIRYSYDGAAVQSLTSSTKPASRTSQFIRRGTDGSSETMPAGSKLDATQFWTRILTDAELVDMATTAKELRP